MIVKLSALGDIVHTFPVIRAMKMAEPGMKIDWAVGEGYTDLVRLSPHVDGVIPFHRREWAKWWRPSTMREIGGFLKHLRAERYDFVLDLQGLLRSGVITFFARAPLKIGFENAREGAVFFYNRKIPASAGAVHAIDRYMASLSHAGINSAAGVGYDLAIPPEDMAWAAETVPKKAYAVLNPNARWKTKLWSVEKFGELAKELHRRHGLRSVIVGGPEDDERCRAVAGIAGDAAQNLSGRASLPRLAAILKGAEVMFTNDSGPMHLAVAVGTPVAAVFGPTNPARTGPYGDGNAVARAGVSCSPCYKRTCPAAVECMTEVSVGDVLKAWESLKTHGRKERGGSNRKKAVGDG